MKGFAIKIKTIWKYREIFIEIFAKVLFMVLLGIITTGSAFGGWLGLITYLTWVGNVNQSEKGRELWEDITEYCFEIKHEIQNKNNNIG
jgi:hypothetical protein